MSAPRKTAAPRKPLDRTRIAVRAALVAAYIGLALVMLFTGRTHTILIDNKDASDGSYAAIDGMAVSVDGLESAEYYPGDRDKAVVNGQRHRIKVEVFADQKVVEKSFSVPFGETMVLLSVPKLLKGIEPFFERFEPLDQAPPPDEASGSQSLGGAPSESTGFMSPAAADPAAPAAP